MKGASNISAFAAYKNNKSKINKVSKKKKKNRDEKRKLHSIVNSSISEKGAKQPTKLAKVINPIKQNGKTNIEPVLENKKRKANFVENGSANKEVVSKNDESKEIEETIKKKKLQPIIKNDNSKKIEQLENGIKKDIKQKEKNPEKIKKKREKQNLQLNGAAKEIKQPIIKNDDNKERQQKRDNDFQQNSSLDNSLENAEKLFQWLLAPITISDFYKQYWEKQPLHIKRPDFRDYFKHVFSSEDLDVMLRENSLFYTRNIDVVTYVDGKRETHNPAEIRATPSAVWDYYSNECSVRVLNPQTYNDKIHLLLATLQEYFGNTMGANVYLTPPGSQGFAPHWDDIEAFVLQLEGRKHWKLYGAKDKNQILARHSSHNLTPDELGPLKYSATVEAGDVLYFPRGTIHEACTDEDSHSLHITVSVYQNTCFGDLLEKVLPDALKKAAEIDVEFRKGLPLRYLTDVGVGAKQNQGNRKNIVSTVKNLMRKLIDHIDINSAADELGRKFMYDSLPPILTNAEKIRSVRNDGEFLIDGKVFNRIEFQPDTKVRLLRQFCLRVVIEGKEAKIYYNTENSRLYHGEEEQFLEIDVALVPAVSHLICSFPNFVAVEDLPIDDDDLKLQIVSDLWERGIVVTEDRLYCIDEENDDDDDDNDGDES